jgi:hypothetical protein
LERRGSTRALPIVFTEGESEKVEGIKKTLPDAVYTNWNQINSALKQAIDNPPTEPIVPDSQLAGYSGTPLPRKLGIRKGSVVILVDAPVEFEQTMSELPEDVSFRRRARGSSDLTIWFTRSRKDLEGRIEKMSQLVGKDGLWIAWEKKASGVSSDLSQKVVRETGLGAGLVDYKVCSIDQTWSGLRFTWKKQD